MKHYTADLVSGGEGCTYLGSILVEVMKRVEQLEPFKFHFYACTFDNNFVWEEYVRLEEFEKETNYILNYAKKHGTGFFTKRVDEISSKAKELELLSKRIIPKLAGMTDDELKKSYDYYIDALCDAWRYGTLTFICESFLSDMLTKSLSRLENATSAISHLLEVEYESFMIESEKSLLRIKDAKGEEEEKLISEYQEEFFYINTNYAHAPVLTKNDVISMAEQTKKHALQKETSDVTLTSDEQLYVDILKPCTIIRDIRKKINLMSAYMMMRFLEEVAKRSGVGTDLLTRSFWFELLSALKDTSFSKKLEKRDVSTIIFDNGKEIYTDSCIIEDPNRGKNETLKGTPASVGEVEGTVRIANGPKDFSSFKEGEILVTYATRPDFVPIMKKARAILTQEGGIISHAAIVARELHIPCIVGIKNLIGSLSSGDIVHVNAKTGEVRLVHDKPKD